MRKGIGNVDSLQKEAVKYVSAIAQAEAVIKLKEASFLTDEEYSILNRCRNSSSKSHPKSCDIVTYRYATGLEGLIGYLDLEGQNKRIIEIMDFIVGDN